VIARATDPPDDHDFFLGSWATTLINHSIQLSVPGRDRPRSSAVGDETLNIRTLGGMGARQGLLVDEATD